METRLKHRVVGLVVLGALAIIFLPLLFKSSTQQPKHAMVVTTMPPAPPKPEAQTVITMQGSDLSPVNNAVVQQSNALANAPRPSASAVMSSEQSQLIAPDERGANQTVTTAQAPVAAAPNAASANKAAFGNISISPVQAEQQQEAAAANKHAVIVAPIVKANPVVVTEEQPTTMETVNPPKAVVSKHVHKEATLATKSKPKQLAEKSSKSKVDKKAEVAATTKALLTAEVAQATTDATKKSNEKNSAAAKIPSASAWVVQLGSFGDPAHAKELVQQLRSKGFTAYSHDFTTSSGKKMTRVVVGPKTKRAEADALEAKLDQDLHLKGVVIAFDTLTVK